MRPPPRIAALLGALLGAAALATCDVPPPSAYITGRSTNAAQASISLGANAAGEACTQQDVGLGAADVFCGTWQQPSARVRSGGQGNAGQLSLLATTSDWRTGLNTRFACDAPQSTTILGDVPAVTLSCQRKIGGWPQVGLVASVGGTVWFGDGVLPALPAMERSIGVMSGRLPASAARGTAGSGDSDLLARRAAAQGFGSGDVGRYDSLMALGSRANQDEDFRAAEDDFRQALAVQQKALGAQAPATARPMLLLAVQVSNQARYGEADGLVARARPLVSHSDDADLQALQFYVQGLNAHNQGRNDAALGLLKQAEAGYAAQLGPEVLNARPRPVRAQILATQSRAGTSGLADLLPDRDLLGDVTTRSAVLGVIEARRYQSIVLRELGRPVEADAAIRGARVLAAASGLRNAVLDGRLARTGAEDAAARAQHAAASGGLALARGDFATSVPESRPVAETDLLRGAALAEAQDREGAITACDSGRKLLRSLKQGAKPELVQPCLDAMAAQSGTLPDGSAEQQALLAKMFETAQLIQGNITSQQIAKATVILAESRRDPRVGDAIRRQQAAQEALGALTAQRDRAGLPPAPGEAASPPPPPDIDAKIAAAQADLADAEQALQVASPNFGQLVQQVASAGDVLQALRPGEAFVGIDLGPEHGWTFLLADGRVSIGRIGAGQPDIAGMVKAIRATIESDTTPPPPFDVKTSQALYQAVFGGLGGKADHYKTLVIAPTGPLLSLPFGLLLTGPAQPSDLAHAPWLLRRAAVTHVPAAANFVSLRRIAGQSRGSRPWFGFGDFKPVTEAQAARTFSGAGCGESAKLFAGLPLLPSKELAAARALMGAGATDEMLGASFTAPAVQKADLKGYRILHFSTHGLLPTDLRCEDEPAIVTSAPAGAPDASGALLTASDVQGMQLDADAVILSACNSGGPDGSAAGQSLSGLARAFFYAGARALMVTHWSVDADASAFLVADTLRRVRKSDGGDFAGALRAAQLELLDSAGKDAPAEIAHPYYWAAFALIGESGANRTLAGL